jgi:hypothetical protein
MQLSSLSLALTRLRDAIAGGPPPGGNFTVLNSAGTSYSAPTTILDSAGTSYTVTKTVLDSAGTSYTVA